MSAAIVLYAGTALDVAKLLDRPDGRISGYRVTQEITCAIIWCERWGAIPVCESVFPIAEKNGAIERAVQLVLGARKTAHAAGIPVAAPAAAK